jgi:hypothetical protein
MSRLGCGYGAARVLVAAAVATDGDGALVRIGSVTLMHCFSEAAGVRRFSGDRERQWDESSQEREQQQKSGGQALHVLLCEAEPQVGQG